MRRSLFGGLPMSQGSGWRRWHPPQLFNRLRCRQQDDQAALPHVRTTRLLVGPGLIVALPCDLPLANASCISSFVRIIEAPRDDNSALRARVQLNLLHCGQRGDQAALPHCEDYLVS